MSKARPSLADRFARKDVVAPPPPPVLAAVAPAQHRDDRVQVLVRMQPAERKALRRIALDQDTTVQAVVEDMIRDFLRRHGG